MSASDQITLDWISIFTFAIRYRFKELKAKEINSELQQTTITKINPSSDI